MPLDNQSCLFLAMQILFQQHHNIHKSVSLMSYQQTQKLKIIFKLP